MKLLEKQTVIITVVTEGEKCEMSDREIIDWYQTHIADLFNPEFGRPQISVSLERTEEK